MLFLNITFDLLGSGGLEVFIFVRMRICAAILKTQLSIPQTVAIAEVPRNHKVSTIIIMNCASSGNYENKNLPGIKLV